ncbi:MAG: ArsR family transcriptional regulator [Proteobacteria bacterium]|nr:MAG: ArsR family transcriptional regulator [Pseudomonadota bacterium]
MERVHAVGLFGTLTRTHTLLLIHMMRETHASEIARVLEISLNQAQRALDSLEKAGIVIGVQEGNTRRVRLNPRYFYKEELSDLLSKMAVHEVPLQEKISEIRRRPRRRGKEI